VSGLEPEPDLEPLYPMILSSWLLGVGVGVGVGVGLGGVGSSEMVAEMVSVPEVHLPICLSRAPRDLYILLHFGQDMMEGDMAVFDVDIENVCVIRIDSEFFLYFL